MSTRENIRLIARTPLIFSVSFRKRTHNKKNGFYFLFLILGEKIALC